MRFHLVPVFVLAGMMTCAFGQESKKTDDVKPPSPSQSKPATEAEKLKGRRVMVIDEGAEIRTRENGVVWRAYLGETLTVSLVNQDWLWIFERQGWLHVSKIVPFETAVYEMNARIKKSRRAENFGLRGIAHLNQGDVKAAIKDFNEVIRRNPNDPNAYVNRGNAYREQGQFKKAIDDYSKAVNLDNDHFLAMHNRALLQTQLEKYDLALKDLNAAVLLNQEYPEAHNARGDVYQLQDRYEEAEKEFTQAIKLYPRYADAYINRAAVRIELEKYDDARKDYSQATLLAPDDASGMNDFAWFLATCPDKEFRNGDRAVDIATTAVELTRERDWSSLDTLGAAYAEAEKFAQAERFAEKARKLAPEEEQDVVKRHLSTYKKRKPIRSR
ncbi:MAG: tetratricopeptide repeat protein [Planctomycetaceae bacterium]